MTRPPLAPVPERIPHLAGFQSGLQRPDPVFDRAGDRGLTTAVGAPSRAG
ncbi:MAG TPA: hypothetical protein VMW47_11385 [Verrucomicrobiae bacterium]|nr:hypothetical protein [Verrucomicrobiae bacterium]